MRAKFIHEKFTEKSDPIEDMGIDLVSKIFQLSKKFYSFSARYYSEKEWKKIISWILDEGYEPWEVLAILDNKIMRWAYDNAGKEKATLDDFQIYNVLYMHKYNGSEIDRVLNSYRRDSPHLIEYYKNMAKEAGIFTESIHEKFTEKSDPIKDMEIGIFSPRTFTNIDKGVDFFIKALPAILETDKIPDDIILPKQSKKTSFYGINPKYEKFIFPYFKKYITSKGEDALWVKVSILLTAVFQLRNMGYPKKVKEDIKESINEKFTEESDPIEDMGIGIPAQIKKFMKDGIVQYQNDEDAKLQILMLY